MTSPHMYSSDLARWMADQFAAHPEKFPGHSKRNYPIILQAIESHFNSKVHPSVQNLANAANGGGFLTDHGPDHIRILMTRCSELVRMVNGPGYEPHVTPYEAFMLLVAAHLHDVGNVYGRDGHEHRILEAVGKEGCIAQLEHGELRNIVKIAASHGGRISGTKDTIGKRVPEGPQNFGGIDFRPQLLAGVLRFGDELADESTRADSFAMSNPTAMPEESRIYHKYAQRLDSVAIQLSEKRVTQVFSVYADDITNEFGKRKRDDGTIEKAYLLDEIIHRSQKCFLEMLYCARFMRPHLPNSPIKLRVEVSAYKEPQSVEPFREPFTWVFRETGYPHEGLNVPLQNICPDYKGETGATLLVDLKNHNG